VNPMKRDIKKRLSPDLIILLQSYRYATGSQRQVRTVQPSESEKRNGDYYYYYSLIRKQRKAECIASKRQPIICVDRQMDHQACGKWGARKRVGHAEFVHYFLIHRFFFGCEDKGVRQYRTLHPLTLSLTPASTERKQVT
jgi:hypothetical protein